MSDSVAYCTTEQVAKVGLEPTNREVLDFESSAYAIPPLGLYTLNIPFASFPGKGRLRGSFCHRDTEGAEESQIPISTR